MKPATLTLKAINDKIEAEQDDGFRAHLGASIIGKKCARELWYDFRWTLRERFSGQMLRLFERGNLEEARFIGYLEKIGAKVWPFDPSKPLKKGKPQQWRAGPWHDGHFGGSPDGFGVGIPDLGPDVPFSISCKTHNEKSFEKLLESGVMGSKWEHFVQEQIYLEHFRKTWGPSLEWCLYMAVCKNTDRLFLDLIHYDAEIASNAISRAADVIYSNEPLRRVATTPGHFACKFCHYNRLCHFGDVAPAVNCRTCSFSRPGSNGKFVCGLRNVDIDEAEQKAGCGSYQVNPKLQGVQP